MQYFLKIMTAFLLALPLIATAQDNQTKTDTTKFLNGKGKIIVKEKDGDKKSMSFSLGSKSDSTRKVLETSWLGFDIGFNNFTDDTRYINPGKPLNPNDAHDGFLGRTQAGDYELRSGKSVHLNFTIVKQQLSLYKNYINVVYGLTYDINNWRYKSGLTWNKQSPEDPQNPAKYTGPFMNIDSASFKTNKLVTNYLQVPLLLRIETSPTHHKKNVYLSAGGYVGYLVRAHTKQIEKGSSNKIKQFEDFNLNKFQGGLQFELGYEGVSLYLKKSLTTLTDYGNQQYPYSFGIRLTGL